MYNYEVGALVVSTCVHELFDLVVTAVDALRVGQYELHLFGKLLETRAGRVRRCDDDFGIGDAGPSVFVVHVVDNTLRINEFYFLK